MLLVSVLIGVTIMVSIEGRYEWLEPIAPVIVISGFFTFLVAVALFVYSIIANLKK
jgi:uncharacterized membrane protein YphA (DoxX/SURF4 family)